MLVGVVSCPPAWLAGPLRSVAPASPFALFGSSPATVSGGWIVSWSSSGRARARRSPEDGPQPLSSVRQWARGSLASRCRRRLPSVVHFHWSPGSAPTMSRRAVAGRHVERTFVRAPYVPAVVPCIIRSSVVFASIQKTVLYSYGIGYVPHSGIFLP
jgi:hypothetical protein